MTSSMRTIAERAGRCLAIFALLLAGAGAVADPAISAVTAVSVTVGDMDRSVEFYSTVLDFQKTSDVEVDGDGYERLFGVFGLRLRVVRLQLGDETLELLHFLAPSGRPIPADSRSNDGWFQHVAIIASDMDQAYARLRAHKVQHASSGPQRLPDWNPNAGGIEAFYFRDPDGHNLEILKFPPGKGAAKWQDTRRLFLGIDHTAITVADTEASLALYRDRLGLAVAGASENYGPEQERLNNVFGARLRITALRAASGPGVELLEYLAPRTGRPMPGDSAANDLWHWHIDMRTAAAAVPDTAGWRLVSPGSVSLPGAELGYDEAQMARDPDGHALLLAY